MINASQFCAAPAPARLTPVSRRTLADGALESLRKAIIAGAFAPGDHIAEASLAQQLGVSRAPVREAMMQLEREGLLVFDRRGAAFVKAFTPEDFEEIFSLRLALECMAARLAARRLTPPLAERLAENIEHTRAADLLVEVTLLDVEFHDLILQAAGHARLYQSWAHLRHQIEVWLARLHSQFEASTHKTREETARHHEKLLETLQSGQPARAEKAMRSHIEGWRNQFPSSKMPKLKPHE